MLKCQTAVPGAGLAEFAEGETTGAAAVAAGMTPWLVAQRLHRRRPTGPDPETRLPSGRSGKAACRARELQEEG